LTTVLFISSNGIGMGHLTRSMAIARRLPQGLRPIVLTMSKGLPTARRQGFFAEYFPSKKVSGLDDRAWTRALAARVSGMIEEHQPSVVAFDGIFPYRGLRNALAAHPEPASVWIRRAMWRPDTGAQQLEYSGIFDAILEPGEFARDADSGPTVARRDEVVSVAPIVFCDDSELLTREQAEAELGLEPGRVHALMQLGEVPQEQRDFIMQTCASQILQRRGTQVVILESAISTNLALPRAVVKLASTYPIARLYPAFDFIISAAGYNSYHELISFQIPAAFFPVRKPTDDQGARARFAEEAGVAVEVGLDATRAVGLLLDESERSRMRRRAEELSFANGAQEAADEIARLASSAERARTASSDGLLQLSTATAAELASVDGIGPVTAKRIIEIRDRAGLSSLDELARVRGIGPATLTELRARLQAER
jgi:DNA uptake protein ComE-like DNA-binding protein